MTTRIRQARTFVALSFVLAAPFMLGASQGQGGCGGTFGSTGPAPNVTGDWAVQYDPMMNIEVKIGGSVYTQQLAASGGTFNIVHGGKTYPFNIDCTKPEVVCPSEVWPTRVTLSQRDPTYKFRMWVTIPVQECSGRQVAPDKASCGTGTLNPDCKPVCDGTIITKSADAFGLIRDGGTGFDLLLGASVASNGVNCALLGLSVAKADLVNNGQAGSTSWTSFEMSNGEVKTGYAGGCLWAGDVNGDGKPEALVLGASVSISTKFQGNRIN